MPAWSAELLVRDCSSLLCHQVFLEGATAPVGPYAAIVRLGPQALGLALPCLVTPCEAVPDSHCLFPGVRVPRGDMPCSSGEGSSPWVL
jgi:hypothetical protein